MLTSMRKHKRFLNIFLWLVIFAFLATIFVVWGLGEKNASEAYVARINDRIISFAELQRRENSIPPETRAMLGTDFREWMVNDIVNTELMLAEAKRIKIPVTNEEAINVITQNAAFMTDGFFDIERYQEVLWFNSLSPSDYENMVKDEIRIGKFMQLVKDSVSITEQEIQLEYIFLSTILNSSYFSVHSAKYTNPNNPDEVALAEYFAQNRERYRIAPQVKLKYITFDREKFDFKPNITEEAVRERYDLMVVNFVMMGIDPEEAMPFEQLKNTIRAEMEEAAVTTAYRTHLYGIYREMVSAGNITAFTQRNPDRFSVSETDFIFENDSSSIFMADNEVRLTLFSLGRTDMSPLMDINGITYIFEISDRINSRLPELNEVHVGVVADYKNNAAFEAAINDVNTKISAENISKSDFSAAAAKFNTQPTTLRGFTRLDVVPHEAWADELVDMLFRSETGEVVIFPVYNEGLIYVVRVDDITKPVAGALSEDMKAQIEVFLRELKGEGALAGVIESLKKRHKVIINNNFR